MSKVNNKFSWEILKRKSDSQDDPRMRVLHLGRRMKQSEDKTTRFFNAIGTTDGVEAVQPLGSYSLQIIIATCFEVDSVVAEIESHVETFISDIVIPSPGVKSALKIV